MRMLSLLFGLLSLTTCFAQSAGQPRVLESLTMHSAILNRDVKYSVVLPEGYYKSKQHYPVVYMLHGLGDNESSWLEYGSVSQLADREVAAKQITPMIFIMPEGYRSYYVNDYAGTSLYQDMFIKELVPMIDKRYRTVADAAHRATLGYSMGGFGALMLSVKNPDVFNVSVPLSISVRTDDQYKTEEASGWDDQWGRLFGAVGKSGEERITDYYKQQSPFHVFAGNDNDRLKKLKIYIDNGDDEGTLCRSNEELHMLMRDKNIPHEFRVRNGGHEFSYWRDAMPNGLHFISDAFEGKIYRGDLTTADQHRKDEKASELIKKPGYVVSLPDEYNQTDRSYPVVFFAAKLSDPQIRKITSWVGDQTKHTLFPPMILVFAAVPNAGSLSETIAAVESGFRARSGFRFRALVGIGADGAAAISLAFTPEQFTSCAMIDVPLNCGLFQQTFAEGKKKLLSRTWFFIEAPDKGPDYNSNGCTHTTLRDLDVYHEYRVAEGSGGTDWAIAHLEEALKFTEKKIHH